MIEIFIPYLLIPLTTLLLAGEERWLTYNFSVIGSTGWGRLGFLLWGILVGGYFHRQLGRLNQRGKWRWLDIGRHLALILFFFALIIPYLPKTAPLLAWIHVGLALVATLILFFLVLAILLRARQLAPRQTRPYLLAMAVIGAVVSALLAAAGIVSTALEVFLVLSNVALLERMEKFVEQCDFSS